MAGTTAEDNTFITQCKLRLFPFYCITLILPLVPLPPSLSLSLLRSREAAVAKLPVPGDTYACVSTALQTQLNYTKREWGPRSNKAESSFYKKIETGESMLTLTHTHTQIKDICSTY